MSKKLKLSQWHDGSVKPVHVGVYQNGDEKTYKYWNGKYWCWAAFSINDAYKTRYASIFQDDKWRGIVK